MKERMQRERNSSIWQCINKVMRPSRGRACREVQRVIDGHTYLRLHYQRLRQAPYPTRMCIPFPTRSQRTDSFHSTWLRGAPPISPQSRTHLQHPLMGTYDIPPFLDHATQLILCKIAKVAGMCLVLCLSPERCHLF